MNLLHRRPKDVICVVSVTWQEEIPKFGLLISSAVNGHKSLSSLSYNNIVGLYLFTLHVFIKCLLHALYMSSQSKQACCSPVERNNDKIYINLFLNYFKM